MYNRNNKINANPDTITNTIVTELTEIPPPNTYEANLKILYEIRPDKDKAEVNSVYEKHNKDLNQAADELLSKQAQAQAQAQLQAPVGIFAERQEGLLCAKHAINNLLQEEKFITGQNIKNKGKDPLTKGQQLSFTDYCETFGNQIDPGGTGHPVCRPNGGEMEINGVQLLLKDILGYRIDYRPLRDQEAIINLQKQKCIGAILRTQEAGGHYVAISKINRQYVLINSLGPLVEPYNDMPSLITSLRNRLKDVITVIYVYDQQNAYESATAEYIRKTWISSGYNEKTFLNWNGVDDASIDIMTNHIFETLRIHINRTYSSVNPFNPSIYQFLSERNIHTLPELKDAVNDFYEGLFIQNPNANVMNPNVMNPNVMNQNVMNPNVMNPNVMNPNVMNPNVMNQNVNPNVMNQNVVNPNVNGPFSTSSPPSSTTSSKLSAPLTPNLVQTVSKYFKNRFDHIFNKAAESSTSVSDFVRNIFADKGLTKENLKTILFVILASIISSAITKKFSGGGSTDVQTIENLLKQLGVSENTINDFEEKVEEENKNVDVIKLVENMKGGRHTRKHLFRHKTRHTVNRL